ncbi:hypothetical protein [Candidatus Tisiphia endosymbiont of Nemotelus uliginosus]|uniref:hypothetical protein n=1 Tax=Candidatus Tisiphia endosymbiont of Nemotelus uliginosus TaxID=3077926 RepID=UPI0035C888A0
MSCDINSLKIGLPADLYRLTEETLKLLGNALIGRQQSKIQLLVQLIVAEFS